MAQARSRLGAEEVGRNILTAAVEVFAARGWDGFTLDAIARAAHVGKSSIYRRYPTREALMSELMEGRLFDGSGIDTGSIDSDLRTLAGDYAEWLDGPEGRLSLRFFVEDRLNDEFRSLWTAQGGARRATTRLFAIIDRAKEQGELDPSVPTEVILHSLLGGVVQHLAASQAASGTVFTTPAGIAFLDGLAASVLRANRMPD